MSKQFIGRSCLTAIIAGVALTTASAPASARHYVAESVEISDFHVFNTDQKSKGAVILIRDFNNNVIDVTLTTNDLVPGNAYSIWIAVFNNPWHCSDECGVDDLPGPNPNADPRVRPSVFHGGGFLADSAGSANASFKIVPGRTSRELFGGTQNWGLQRLWGTEIHIVLRSHGPALDPTNPADAAIGSIANQIGTASEACNPTCANVFASIHPPR